MGTRHLLSRSFHIQGCTLIRWVRYFSAGLCHHHLLVKLLVPQVNIGDFGGVFLAQPPFGLQLVPLRVEGVEGPGEAHLDEEVPDEVVDYRGSHLHEYQDRYGMASKDMH